MNNDVILLPHYELTSGRSQLPSEVNGDIASITLNEEINLPAMVSVTLNFWDGSRQKVKESYLDQFTLGSAMEVKMGMNKLVKMFTGEVTVLEPSLGGEESGETLTVHAYDKLHRLRFGTKQRVFKDVTTSQIVENVARDYHMATDIEKTSVTHAHVTQNNISDMDFVLELAKPIDYELTYQDDTLMFRKNKADQKPAVTLVYRRDLLTFTPRIRAVSEGNHVEVRGWDMMTKQAISSTAKPGDEVSKMGGKFTGSARAQKAFQASTLIITDYTVKDADEAQRIAKAWLNRTQRAFVEAEGTSLGNPEIRPGATLNIIAVGKGLEGTYYVKSATHTFGTDGFRTEFKVVRNAL